VHSRGIKEIMNSRQRVSHSRPTEAENTELKWQRIEILSLVNGLMVLNRTCNSLVDSGTLN
jgi:hypothetical protein